jgi:hypothetical protein
MRQTLKINDEFIIHKGIDGNGSPTEETFFTASSVEPNGIEMFLEIKIKDKKMLEEFQRHYINKSEGSDITPGHFITIDLKHGT